MRAWKSGWLAVLLIVPALIAGCAASRNPDGVAASSKSAQSLEPERWITDWTVLGPFPNADDRGLDTDLLRPKSSERELMASGAAEVLRFVAATPSVKTHRVSANRKGFVDLEAAFSRNQQTVAYAWAEFESDVTGYALLRVGSDDGIRVLFNGDEVIRHHVHRAAEPDQDRAVVFVQRGVNRCVLKIEQTTGGWGFYVRLGEVAPYGAGLQLHIAEPPEPPVILLGSALPIRQHLHLTLLSHGALVASDARIRCRATNTLLESISPPFSLDLGQMTTVTLELIAGPAARPTEHVPLVLDVLTAEGRMQPLVELTTRATPCHPLLQKNDPARSDPVVIVQLSDTHIERPDSELLGVETAKRLQQTVAEINLLQPRPDFVVVTGDFTHNSMDAYPVYKKIMDRLEVPYLTVFGNHDKASSLAAAARALSEWGLPEYSAFVYKGYPVVLLDSVGAVNPAYGEINLEQRKWLFDLLRQAPDSPRLLFVHHDLFSGIGVKNVDGIQRILSGCEGETWVFSGHWHADTFVRMGLQRHVITTSTGYLFPMDTLPHDRKAPGYRLIEIRDGKVHTRFKPLGAVAVEDPPIDEYLTQEEALRALGK